MSEQLTFEDHNRDTAGMRYVYPVVSRRAGGVSVGINLNVNNACNWRCVYCQVPGLTRGAAPAIDLGLLERELASMLDDILEGDFMERHVAPSLRRLNDIALSGNGEPTTSHDFDRVIEVAASALSERGMVGQTKLVVISNGSLVDRPEVLRGLERMGAIGGELWYKLDSATPAGRKRLNDTGHDLARIRRGMGLVAERCRLRVQTMALAFDGAGPSAEERAAYLDFLRSVLAQGTPISDVMLYGLVRESYQPEASRLSPLPVAELDAIAEEIRTLGIPVLVHP